MKAKRAWNGGGKQGTKNLPGKNPPLESFDPSPVREAMMKKKSPGEINPL
jgi:hypothetical protein